MYTKIRWSVPFLFVTPLLYSLAAPLAFKNGLIIDLVHPYLALPTVFIACYMYRYVTEFREKLALRGAFAKYLNPKLVEQISEHPETLKLGGEKRDVTVMFTDIAHFTSISEKLKPESLVALLNEYFEVMSEVIMEEGGTLDKFEGDAIMAFFGAPVVQPDHALRAARTAIKMRLRLTTLLEKWKKDPPLPGGEPKPQIDFRCGMNTGEVIVGNMGSSDRFDYTVMGDVVNLGSRLEGANKKYETSIMVSQKTAEIIKDAFEMRELDTIKVKGKTEPNKVYELLAPKGELPAKAMDLLQQYNEGIALYHSRKFAEGLSKFQKILETYPTDGPSKLYRQRCEVLRDFPPPADWNGVFEMGSK
jgi:adenylate cyclase